MVYCVLRVRLIVPTVMGTEVWVQIHWFSIINSCVTVLLLTGFLATILMRVLKNDFVKYTRDDEAGAAPPQLHGFCCSTVLFKGTNTRLGKLGVHACMLFQTLGYSEALQALFI